MPTETTTERARLYETTAPLLRAMRGEIKDLAKKKPDATLSKIKVAMINRLLVDLQELLKEEPNSKYLDVLSDEDLPQYSDVVLIMSQYDAAMDSFRARHSEYDSGERTWLLSDGDEHDEVDDDDDDEDDEVDDEEDGEE